MNAAEVHVCTPLTRHTRINPGKTDSRTQDSSGTFPYARPRERGRVSSTVPNNGRINLCNRTSYGRNGLLRPAIAHLSRTSSTLILFEVEVARVTRRVSQDDEPFPSRNIVFPSISQRSLSRIQIAVFASKHCLA
ncbi:uncharacterized protein LOC112459518 [Temnothorax curvispinosus]|uniref:Uncharacterized protein LOC112459518 n=1 Tax=Temnothorax curvispinosus TaxID=300111 RepID=A0A6J1QAY2_9HYME|nr:uncharacterized protein LOC112459518 [Temnothorax curvispinosus]